MNTTRFELGTSGRVAARAIIVAGAIGAIGVLAACGGNAAAEPSGSPSNSGGTGGAGGISSRAGGGMSGGAESVAGTLAACPVAPPALGGTGASVRIDIPVQLVVNASPLTIGTPATGREGREYTLSLLKLFLTEPTLVDENSQETKAQLVDADGKPLPYAVHLVDADDPATQLLRLAVPGPQRSYSALHLGVGVAPACNRVTGTDQIYPLNPDSDMFWTWGSQFLFVRAEGAARLPPSTEWSSFTYHVGFDAAFANVRVPGAPFIGVGASGPGPTLAIDVDRLLETDEQTLPTAKHNVPDGWIVDNMETKQVFSFR